MERTIVLVIGIVIILLTITKPNFGFVPFNNLEAIGYNLWSLIVYIGGGFIIYKYFKHKDAHKNHK